jgi:hypothetical protein
MGKRVVSGVFVNVSTLVDGPLGKPRQVVKTYRRGETVDLTDEQEARLDELGMLADPGATGEQVDQQVVDRQDEVLGQAEAAKSLPDLVETVDAGKAKRPRARGRAKAQADPGATGE